MRYVKKIIKKEKYVVHMLSNGVEFNRTSPELGKTPNSGLNLFPWTINRYPAIKRGGKDFFRSRMNTAAAVVFSWNDTIFSTFYHYRSARLSFLQH